MKSMRILLAFLMAALLPLQSIAQDAPKDNLPPDQLPPSIVDEMDIEEQDKAVEEARKRIEEENRKLEEEKKKMMDRVNSGEPKEEVKEGGTKAIEEAAKGTPEEDKKDLEKKFEGAEGAPKPEKPKEVPVVLSADAVRYIAEAVYGQPKEEAASKPPAPQAKDAKPSLFDGFLSGKGIGSTAGWLAILIGIFIPGGGLAIALGAGIAAYGVGSMAGSALTGKE